MRVRGGDVADLVGGLGGGLHWGLVGEPADSRGPRCDLHERLQ